MITMMMFVVTVSLSSCKSGLVQKQLCHLTQKTTRAFWRPVPLQEATTKLPLFLASYGNATAWYHMANQLQKKYV
jgi:hypothetical protein